MAPPDGSRAPRIPALSWDSVVETAPPADEATGPAEQLPNAPAAEPAAPIEPLGFVALGLDLDLDAAPSPDTPPSETPVAFAPVVAATPAPVVAPPAPAPVAAQAPVAAPTPVAAPVPVVAPAPLAAPVVPADAEPVSVRTVAPMAIVPAIGDVTSGPESLAPTSDVGVLPPIQEATPAVQPVVQVGGPSLPSVAPAVQRHPAASSFEFDAASVAAPPTRQPTRRKRRSGLKLLLTLVVLGALVAAGVVFGQPYLFPSDWDDATAPYAEAVETSSGVEFIEPLTITALPSGEFAARLTSQIAPTSPQEVAQWRALGLATGVVDDATLAAQLAGWRDVVYTASDGQVYHDAGAAGPGLDAQLVQAMAAASLDQEFAWSADQAQRSVDAAAATSAEVLRQVSVTQRSSSFAGATEPVPTAQLAGLPTIVGYSLLAPHVLAEFPAEDGPNPLIALSSNGRAPEGDAASVPPSLPLLAAGDVMIESPMSQDSSFWFLVFAGVLDGPTAFAASEAIVENSLVNATRGATNCVYATFSGGGVDQTATLRSALDAWTEQAPVEFASTLTALPDGSLQLSSCDPGPAFVAPLRAGVVGELIAYRSLELATAEAVVEQGGGEPEFAFVWSLITSSNMPAEVAAFAAGSPPGQIATTAIDAVAALYELAG